MLLQVVNITPIQMCFISHYTYFMEFIDPQSCYFSTKKKNSSNLQCSLILWCILSIKYTIPECVLVCK